MKQFKVKMRIKINATSTQMLETVITANSSTEAKRLAEAQYAGKLDYLYGVTEIR